jgi:hypothetical protein
MELKSPIKILSLRTFRKRYGSMLGSRAEISDFEKTLIESNYNLMWLDGFEPSDYEDVKRTAIAANYFLEKGTIVKHRNVVEAVFNISNNIILELNKCIMVRGKIRELEMKIFDERIEQNLKFYQTIYEALMPLILSPIVYAFSLHNNIKDKAFVPRDDGRIKLDVIKKMENWLLAPQNRLARGLNDHVRNAYAHSSYRILDGGNVEIVDVNPYKPNQKWGPEIWSLDQLEKLTHKIWVNVFGILDGLLIFIMNNRKLARGSNWNEPKPLSIKLRKDEFHITVEKYCYELSFTLKESNNNIYCLLKIDTQPKGLDQTEKMVLIYADKSSRKIDIPVVYREQLILNQVISLLKQLQSFFLANDKFQVIVDDYNNVRVGQLKGVFQDILKIDSTKDPTEYKFELNTFGDQKMWVRFEKQLR